MFDLHVESCIVNFLSQLSSSICRILIELECAKSRRMFNEHSVLRYMNLAATDQVIRRLDNLTELKIIRVGRTPEANDEIPHGFQETFTGGLGFACQRGILKFA